MKCLTLKLTDWKRGWNKMINRAVIVGRLVRDPVLRKTTSGASVTSFTVAVDRKFKAEGQPTADFIQCTSWNKVADNVAKYMKKGFLIGVEGRLQTRSYENKDGKKQIICELVAESTAFLEQKDNHNTASQSDESVGGYKYTTDTTNSLPQEQQSGYSEDYGCSNNGFDIASDDLPF